MPTYTYRCQKCGHEFERFQSMSDEPVKRCERCKGKVQRVFHPVGIVLKGPGFHKTDYRSSKRGSGDQKSGEKSTSEKPSEGSSTSSDPKTETSSSTDTGSKGKTEASGSSPGKGSA